jgi:hypothetical protein
MVLYGGEMFNAEGHEPGNPFMLFLEPWNRLSGERASFFEKELARELAPHHVLYGMKCAAVAITGESDDVLFRLDDGRFSQVHLTYTRNAPERPGYPNHRVFETLGDWMIDVMVEEHIDHFGLW